jgi:cephalosporin hydroxylase
MKLLAEIYPETYAMAGSDKGTFHSYIEFYDRLFFSLQRTAKSFMEIGVFRGGSMLMWSRYFNENCSICGVDTDLSIVEPKAAEELSSDPRVELVQANAYSKEFVQKLKEEKASFDIIIDDGSHKVDDLLFVLNEYPRFIKFGGMLICEDIKGVKLANWLLDNSGGDVHFRSRIVDLTKTKKKCDNILIVYHNLNLSFDSEKRP